ncbi:AsmA family protein [Thiohalomonas denitrificans]|uniref:AsmA family protein n=1 Tax=Thiohalomonas denitrificans TaxID=415747 RepID=A0A1G5QVQ0_9GAMM|nr:hypothetical protein [Thiohalomonas denitrificans]SCZ65812.1 hypothetical protein SAMN03097708_02883 [Thiohalomonas denitrificans]
MQRTVTWLALPSVLLAIALYFLALPAAKLWLTKAGEYALGVVLDIDHIELEYQPWPLLTSAPAVLHLVGVEMANPPGFEAPGFMAIRRIDVRFTPVFVRENPMVISEVRLHGLSLNVERRELVSNAGIILTRLAEFDTRESLFDLDKQFVIESVVLQDGAAQITHAPTLGPGGQLAVSFDDRPHYRIAKADGGVGLTTLLYEVIDRVVSDALVRVARDGEARKELEASLLD